MSRLALVLAASYLIGSIPTALVAGRALGKIDIRKHGSGNAGATNVYRLFGLRAYLAVLSLDMLKGYLAVTLLAPLGAGYLAPQRTALYCAVFAVLGHVWTIFAGFRGGKGVATAGGAMLGLAPLPGLCAICVYLVITLTTGYVALGSMLAAISLPVAMATLDMTAQVKKYPVELLAISVALAGLIIYTHRVNIRRLLKGEENKTDFLARFKKER